LGPFRAQKGLLTRKPTRLAETGRYTNTFGRQSRPKENQKEAEKRSKRDQKPRPRPGPTGRNRTKTEGQIRPQNRQEGRPKRGQKGPFWAPGGQSPEGPLWGPEGAQNRPRPPPSKSGRARGNRPKGSQNRPKRAQKGPFLAGFEAPWGPKPRKVALQQGPGQGPGKEAK